MKLEYSNANDLLFNEFEEIKNAHESNFEDYNYESEDKCYAIYEREFTPYVLKQLRENNKRELKKIFRFVEKLISSGDFELANMVGVTVIESLYYKNVCFDFKDTLFIFCGKETLKGFEGCLHEDEKAEWERHKPAIAA